MNKTRRKAISELVETLQGLREEIEELASQEAAAKDALPDSLQETDKAGAMDEAAAALESAAEAIDFVVDELRTAYGDTATF